MLAILQRQPLVALFALVLAVLVVVIGLETGFGARLGPTIPTGVSKPATPFEAKLMPALAPTDPERSYPEMTARPLFVPLRRPAPPAEPVQQVSIKRGLYTLQGVTISGDTRIGLLKEKSTGHIVRAEKGKDLNGMKVAEVTPDSVVLAAGTDQEVIALQVVKPGAAGPTTPPGGPFGPTGPAGGFTGPATSVAPPGTAPGPNPPNAPQQPQAAPPNPVAPTVPQATTTPMTPEELLARRRARRAQ